MENEKTKIYPPDCEGPTPLPPKYCYGYEKFEILVKDGCPCAKQQEKEKSEWLYPDNCDGPDPGPDPKHCVGYEHMDVKTTPCPCAGQ